MKKKPVVRPMDATIKFLKNGNYQITVPKSDRPISITIADADGYGPVLTFNAVGGIKIGQAMPKKAFPDGTFYQGGGGSSSASAIAFGSNGLSK